MSVTNGYEYDNLSDMSKRLANKLLTGAVVLTAISAGTYVLNSHQQNPIVQPKPIDSNVNQAPEVGVSSNGEPKTQTAQSSGPSTITPISNSPDNVDYDCPDFATQTEAQDYFDSQGGSPSNNVDRLDRDRDGIACEDN